MCAISAVAEILVFFAVGSVDQIFGLRPSVTGILIQRVKRMDSETDSVRVM